MNSILHELELDIPAVCEEIETLIKDKMIELLKNGAVVGLSGGLDSTVTAFLVVQSLGTEKFIFLIFLKKTVNLSIKNMLKSLLDI